MGKLSSRCVSVYDGVILSFILLSQLFFQIAWCGSILKFLPGLEGPLSFVLETGYVGVGESEQVQVFYYFTESENNPKNDPVLFWLTGGPGCSALSGLAHEIGPFAFKAEEYNGSRPNLESRPQSWTKWLIDHPKFLSNEFYIGGDSYSGIHIPAIVQEISQGNEKGLQPWINLQGYVLGNPKTTEKDTDYRIPFAHGMGLISDELYESLQKNCKGDYTKVDPANVLCSRDIESFNEATSDLEMGQILLPYCGVDNDDDADESSLRRSLMNKYREKNFINTDSKLPPISCWNYVNFISNYWANDENVRSALHIRKGTIGKWRRCSSKINYNYDIPSSYEYHVNISKKGYRSLIYSGDHDLIIPFLGTQAWIRSLNYSIVDDWRQWHTNDGQVAGYTRTYSNRMTFATVKGGSHTAPDYKPEQCLAMYSRWISKTPL